MSLERLNSDLNSDEAVWALSMTLSCPRAIATIQRWSQAMQNPNVSFGMRTYGNVGFPGDSGLTLALLALSLEDEFDIECQNVDNLIPQNASQTRQERQ